MIAPLTHIADMAPYALAKIDVPDGKRLISLSQNESLRPPSPKVLEAASASLVRGALYPDPDWTALRQGLAGHHDVPEGSILCGAGSLDLIGCIARAFAGPGRAILAPAHAYPFFRSAAQMANARFDSAPEVDQVVSVDALLDAVTPETAIVFVANPGNPTGTRIPRSDLLRLRAGLRDDILLVIDEAYGEFADHLGERMFDLVERGDTIVLRTFSKAYGMAGFRVGWGSFPEPVAAEVRKVMNPNNIPAASQAAAQAALMDIGYMHDTCALVAEARESAAKRLTEAGFRVLPSYTNFLLIDFEAAKQAEAADTALRAKGIFLRGQGGVGLPHMLRMTLGPAEDMTIALDYLTAWKRGEMT